MIPNYPFLKRLFFLGAFLVSLCSNGQDLIITQENDSIQCRISRISELYIHYTVSEVRSRISKDDVSDYQWNSKNNTPPVVPPPPPPTPTQEVEQEPPITPSPDPRLLGSVLPKLSIELNVGFSYQFEGYDGLPDDYVKQVRTLLNFGTSVHYFPSEKFGIGVRYARAVTNADHTFDPSFASRIGFSTIEETIRFDYIGVSILSRQVLPSEKQFVYYGLAGGLLSYRDDGNFDGVSFFEEGETFGLNLALAYDHQLNDKIGIGIGLDVLIARITEINFSGTTISGLDFGVSRFDIKTGIRFYK